MESNHVPVVIGNYAPFRLVLRETDNWNFTLDQVYNREYDYVKLCRLSCFIDIGIAPFSLGVSFGGSLILPATEKYSNREDASDTFNETLETLLLGGVYSEAIQPIDISYGTLFSDGYVKSMGGGTGAISSFHRAIETKLIGPFDGIPLIEPETILNSDIEKAYKRGKSIISKLDNLSPSLLLNGTSHYVKHQWTEGLIFLWTSIEQLVNIIWNQEIINDESQGDTVIEGRTRFLKDYRTWTTSTRIEVLYQRGFISADDYHLLNSARKARNDFVHNGEKLNERKVRCALEGFFRLISLIITDYQNPLELKDITDHIFSNQRGDLYPKKTTLNLDEVKYWHNIPPLPGDKNWDGKEYEIIEELVLRPLKRENS